VIHRFYSGRNHGLHPTVVEEVLRGLFLAQFGKWIWDGMKTKACQMWRPNTGRIGLDQFAGSYFLDRLADLQRAQPNFVIDLVGHSAGAIAICQLLAETVQRQPPVRIRNVLLLAPACTVELFYREVVSQPNRFEQFRMFALRDQQERRDRLLPFFYPWSLLYFVSGTLEANADDPILGMERFALGIPARDSPELRATVKFLQVTQLQRVVWAGEPGSDGLYSEAQTHGAFDDDRVTLESLRWIISH
jgi:hypothetical protein